MAKSELYHTARNGKNTATLHHGDAATLLRKIRANSVDLIVTSPPYCVGKEYEKSTSAEDFLKEHKKIFPLISRVLKPGGSVCWQIGNHVKNGKLIPLDALVYIASLETPELILRNRIVWTFGHGVHCSARFSGRHETILWFTKGDQYKFHLDAVRTPQKYPGKRHYKGPHAGKWSGNPNGKNPTDVWDIPNVKAKHAEKTLHPCQFPIALVTRLILALSKRGARVVDPYLGSGTTAVAALREKRNFVGGDKKVRYLKIARKRLADLKAGTLKVREDVPVRIPDPTESVSIVPPHFVAYRNGNSALSEHEIAK